MSQTHVVAAIIQKGSKFLLGKRALGKRSAPGYWSPICGKIEPGESEVDAVVRECFEEVGLTVKAIRKTTEFNIDKDQARLHWWLVDIIEGQEFLKNDEHTELCWFNFDEMKNLENISGNDIEVFASLCLEP